MTKEPDKRLKQKIAIVTDSSIALTKKESEDYDVFIVPSTITHNKKSYLDQLTITTEEVNELLAKNERLTSSQPNIALIVEKIKEVQKLNYDYTIILTVSKHISGGYNAFHQAAEIAELKKYTVVDTRSAAGPAQQAVRAIRKMNQRHATIEEILNYLKFLFENQITYIFPQSLEYIVKSGRVSKTVARISSLFKIKTLLYLNKASEKVERLGNARTDQRIFDLIIQNFKDNKVDPKHYDLYLLENRAQEKLDHFKEYLFEKIGKFNYYQIKLPAVLSTHTGSGTLGVQWCPKLPE